jgi:hypothetical protein
LVMSANNPLNLPISNPNILVSVTTDPLNPFYGCWKFIGRTSTAPSASVRKAFYGNFCPNPPGNPNCL